MRDELAVDVARAVAAVSEQSSRRCAMCREPSRARSGGEELAQERRPASFVVVGTSGAGAVGVDAARLGRSPCGSPATPRVSSCSCSTVVRRTRPTQRWSSASTDREPAGMLRSTGRRPRPTVSMPSWSSRMPGDATALRSTTRKRRPPGRRGLDLDMAVERSRCRPRSGPRPAGGGPGGRRDPSTRPSTRRLSSSGPVIGVPYGPLCSARWPTPSPAGRFRLVAVVRQTEARR